MIVDGDGKFAFRGLAAGQYRISATRDGYVGSEYGQRGPNGSGTPLTLTAQQHATDIRIGLTSTGAIGGRIVNRYGEPIGNANVQAMRYVFQDGRRVLNVVQTVRTNDRGEYRLFWLTPGQYIVSAQPQEQINVDGGGTMIFQTRAAGGPLGILGPNGPQLGVGGVTRITVTAGNNPGDFPAFGGPGAAAPPPPPPPPPPPAVADNAESYVPIYFPGTTDIGAAMPIDLHAGGSVEGVNLTAADVRPVKVRGQVLSGGRPAAGAQVSLYQRNNPDGSITMRQFNVNDTGQFEFRNVAPGSYEVAATMNGAGPAAMILGTPLATSAGLTVANAGVRGGRGGGPMMGVRVPVDITTADVDGLALVLENGFSVSGRISVEGTVGADANAGLTGIRLQLQMEPSIPTFAVPPTSPDMDGNFSFSGLVPGIYRLQINPMPRGGATYIKAARLAGVDILANGMRVDSEPRGPLEIILGSTPGSLDVTTLDEKQMPEAAVRVVLVPDANPAKRYMFKDGTSDATGKFHWDNLAPGDYKVYAWEDVENGAWTDADFMKAYEGRGTQVHIDERGRANATVRVIPYKAN